MIERISAPDGSESNVTCSMVPRVTDAQPHSVAAAAKATIRNFMVLSPLSNAETACRIVRCTDYSFHACRNYQAAYCSDWFDTGHCEMSHFALCRDSRNGCSDLNRFRSLVCRPRRAAWCIVLKPRHSL